MYVRPRFTLLQLLLGLLALAFVPLSASAGVPADKAAFQAFMGTVAGNNTSIAFGAGGKVLATSAASGAGWVTAGNMGVAAAATPALGMLVKGTAMVEAAPGVMVPVVAASGVTGANLWAGLKAASAIGASLVGGPWGVAFLGAGAVLDWMTRAGVRPNPDGSGTLQRSDPTVCTVAPCYNYKDVADMNPPNNTLFPSLDAACSAYVANYSARFPADGAQYLGTGGTPGSPLCRLLILGTNYTYAPSPVSVPPSSATWLPASMDDIAPYMQAVQPSPNVVQQILNTGATLQTEPVTVTAPSTVVGPTTTTQNADGTKTVTTTTYNFSTAGDTITNTGPTTTTTTYNADNSVKSTSTSTTAPGPNDQPAQTDCDKFPDNVACTKLGTPPLAERLPSSPVAISLTPSVFTSSAGCPADIVVPVHVGPFSQSATISFSGLCNAASTYVYPLVMLIGAALAGFIFVGGLKS